MNILNYKMDCDFIFEPSAESILGAPEFHIHEGYEMLYLISGKLDFFIKDQVYFVSPGDMVFIPKKTIHKSLNHAKKI